MAMLKLQINSAFKGMQARDYFGLTVIWGRSPRRARKIIEL